MPHLTPAVFVHGLLGPFNDPAAFRALEHRRCSAPHLLGYGGDTTETISVDAQVEAVRDHVREQHGDEPVHLVAHSIGAVYALEYAARYPGAVASVVNVEGNFSLADAFWSKAIAAMSRETAQVTLEGVLADAEGWLRKAGIEPTESLIVRAQSALAYQPWMTVWASAKAIVSRTGSDDYQATLTSVFEQVPVHLVAGERSASGWAVPEWARKSAASYNLIPDVGHMMMLEQPETFGAMVASILR